MSPGKRQESSWNISGSSQVTVLSVGFKDHGEGDVLETEPERTSSAFAVTVCRNKCHLDLFNLFSFVVFHFDSS